MQNVKLSSIYIHVLELRSSCELTHWRWSNCRIEAFVYIYINCIYVL